MRICALILILVAVGSFSEPRENTEYTKKLKPKHHDSSGRDSKDPFETRELKPKKRIEILEPLETKDATTLSILLATPLIREESFLGRFSALGGGALFSVPLFAVSKNQDLSLQTGALFLVSQISLAQPNLTFTFFALDVPVLARVGLPVSSSLSMEVFAGAHMRAWEYDSRTTTDGGSRLLQAILPEFGVGGSYAIDLNWTLRLRLSYILLALGVELKLSV